MNTLYSDKIEVDWKHSLGLAILLFSVSTASAQDVPADLLSLSLEELFAAEIDDGNRTGLVLGDNSGSRWTFQMRYQKSEFSGYNDGSHELSIDDVLFVPGTEARTNKNFPVVPTVISQQVQALVAGYNVNNKLSMQIIAPYIKQSTDHISIIPGYSDFVIESKGIGDVTLLGTYRLNATAENNWMFSFGLSVPTGSIDEQGDTPRAAGDQQIPYSMQLGSGTYDLPLSLAYNHPGNKLSWGGELSTKIRLGDNDRNYTLGNRATVSSWVRLNSIEWVKPSINLSYEYSGEIRGLDTDLTVPLAFQFPAPVTNPEFYGGKQANVVVSFRFPLGVGKSLDMDFGQPIYQSLNGPQVREDVRFGVTLNLSI